MVQIVQARGYAIETHFVTTEDGYILTVFRIPGSLGSAPVLLQHGLLDSSYTWVSNFQDESMAYMLADAGFDVWLGNNRGNTYGRNHTSLNPDFSYDAMAIYDGPAMIDYITAYTAMPSMAWVGHSEGTMQFFAGASLPIATYPTVKAYEKINLFIGLAPVGSISNIKSPELVALAHTKFAERVMEMGIQEFFPTNSPDNKLDSKVCQLSPHLCVAGLATLCGPTLNLNASRLQVYVSETPAGTSTVNMNHFVQGIVDRQGLFRMYNWGSPDANAAHYNGAEEPPIYDLTQYKVPSALFSGKRDWMADPKDVKKLYDAIPAEYIVYSQVNEGFAHLDYVWAPSAGDKVYKPAIELLRQYADSSV
eukprot:GSChrysophyteH2.ASY1.ANO1.1019.1 assembled CDS